MFNLDKFQEERDHLNAQLFLKILLCVVMLMTDNFWCSRNHLFSTCKSSWRMYYFCSNMLQSKSINQIN